MALQTLPGDTLKTMCGFLTGFDAFELSHTNSWWLRFLQDGFVWQHLLVGTATDTQRLSGPQWKQQYMLSRSFVFQGRSIDDQEGELGSFVYLTKITPTPTRDFHLTQLESQSFSFDTWFSLLPATNGKWLGGIIYGLQSASWESRRWPTHHQQFVVVSSTGDLFCSVLDSKPLVASNLETNRWYHLALSYDYSHEQQVVYLDGEQVQSGVGALHRDWRYFAVDQIGTGCVAAGNDNFPRPGHLGWFGFNGVVDEFRVWKRALPQEDIVTLAHAGKLASDKMHASMKMGTRGSILGRFPDAWVNVKLTKCTRPAIERSMQRPEESNVNQKTPSIERGNVRRMIRSMRSAYSSA